ncbi:spermatogenesis-associated protein 24-like [Xenia sp. Carnegie-2017]|uniref:spermatogenesis-associated protein 24-like n=1 Tax=Xenia sp. Carnegie-2017 TaxID=2897299 RepID=UPI001F04C134|nr:spermatogenesis-associated protein 24-like [Xenia sp. Carnegie-2017]
MAEKDERNSNLPSYIIVTRQQQDLIRTQNAAIVKLQCMLKSKEVSVPHEDYQALVTKLDEERLEHMKTKAKLAEKTEKLHFAEGKIETLKSQLEREKKTFEEAFKKLKTKAIDEAHKNDELYNKCLEMEELCGEKDNGLSFQDAKIKDLRSRIARQKQIHKQLVENLDIELKQEQYVARNLQTSKSTKTARIAPSRIRGTKK